MRDLFPRGEGDEEGRHHSGGGLAMESRPCGGFGGGGVSLPNDPRGMPDGGGVPLTGGVC
jgi:hypothetical protein